MEKKKRDLIEEIKLIKSRTEFNSRYDYVSRLNDIEYAISEFLDYNGDFNNELLKYIPISTVACFEAFFRSAIKEIIDFGKPYSNNVGNLNQAKNVKLDFEVIAAIQTKSFSVGDFVGHILPLNNFDDINSILSILLMVDFTQELKSFNKISKFEESNKAIENFKNRFVEIFQSVNETYTLRHIFCHEFATNIKIDKEKIVINFKNCQLFLEQCNTIIWEILYPNSPETQTEINIWAEEKFKGKNDELQQLLKAIKQFSKETIVNYDETIFDECMSQWEKYRDLHAQFNSNSVKGGSMHPSLYFSNLENITKEKIISLKEEYGMILRKNNYS